VLAAENHNGVAGFRRQYLADLGREEATLAGETPFIDEGGLSIEG